MTTKEINNIVNDLCVTMDTVHRQYNYNVIGTNISKLTIALSHISDLEARAVKFMLLSTPETAIKYMTKHYDFKRASEVAQGNALSYVVRNIVYKVSGDTDVEYDIRKRAKQELANIYKDVC